MVALEEAWRHTSVSVVRFASCYVVLNVNSCFSTDRSTLVTYLIMYFSIVTPERTKLSAQHDDLT